MDKKKESQPQAPVSVSVIIPVFNEEESIAAVIKQIKKVMESTSYGYEIIAVNDGSADKSEEILNGIPEIRVMNHPYNIGYGASLKTGITEAKNEWIVMLDADGTYPIDEIPQLLKYAGEHDLVSGVRAGKDAKIPLMRRPAKFILSKLANFLSGQKIPDINCGMRVIKKSNVMQFFKILPARFSFTITHLLACLTNDYTVKFVPIKYHHRQGKSTIHPIKDFVKFINIIIRVITYFKPFKTFGTLSVVLFLAGILIFFYSFLVLGKIMDITVVVILLASLQVFLFGLIADLIVKKNN